MSNIFSKKGVNINQANCRATGDDQTVNTFEVTISDLSAHRSDEDHPSASKASTRWNGCSPPAIGAPDVPPGGQHVQDRHSHRPGSEASAPLAGGGRSSGRMVFLSGQIPLDPATGEMVPGDVGAQTTQVMKNLGAVLTAAGLSFDHVVRCTIFVVDLADFGVVNATYGKAFSGAPPARATVQVAALPRGARVEIDAIAVD
jgi:2-iminobutanoate/2-iminopropanoate deaminase